jgi:uncharacterized protein
MIALLISGLLLGIFGSLHCVGMCGPIALALPIHQYSKFKKYLAVVLYNLGRAVTYGLLGLVFGSIGQSFYLVNLQQSVSIVMGLFLLASVFLAHTNALSFFKLNFLRQAIQVLKIQVTLLFKKNGLSYLFLIGLLNGLLPCGLVYMAMAVAIASGHALSGLLLMFAFGLGTFPIMIALIAFGQAVNMQYRNAFKKSMPYITALMAIILIMRGLNLGIPYLSPKYEAQSNSLQCTEHSKMLMQYCMPPKRKP